MGTRQCIQVTGLSLMAVLVVFASSLSPRKAITAKARLQSNTLSNSSAARPKDFTKQLLAAELERLLTDDEFSLVVNPLATTSEMEEWAAELTLSATNDLQRAEWLCVAIGARTLPGPIPKNRYRTAAEVFNEWRNPESGFLCLEFTYLYVALARTVGLNAYAVFVDEDCYGSKVAHACAAVFLNDKPILVDPTWSTFGIQHKKFTIVDDLQLIAEHLTYGGDIKHQEIACKLAPKSFHLHLTLFEMLAREGRWDDAETQVAILRSLASDSPMTCYAQALMDFYDGRPGEAAFLLGHAIRLAPETERFYCSLGNIYAAQGTFREAREYYQNALRYSTQEENKAFYRKTIAAIDGKLLTTTLTNAVVAERTDGER